MRFCCWVMCILCIFWILTPYRKYCLQRFFSPSIGGLFILLTVSFTVKSFLIWCSPIYLSLLFFAQEAAAAAKSRQLCLTLCDPIDSSPPGSPIPGILQARPLEWVAISFSSAWKWSRSVVSDSSWPHGLQPTRLLHPWDFPGKSTGVGCHCLLPCPRRLYIKNIIKTHVKVYGLYSLLGVLSSQILPLSL